MVVKEYLENESVNLQRFQQLRKSNPKPRRRLNRMVGGEITVPTSRTDREIKETLKVSCMAQQKTKSWCQTFLNFFGVKRTENPLVEKPNCFEVQGMFLAMLIFFCLLPVPTLFCS